MTRKAILTSMPSWKTSRTLGMGPTTCMGRSAWRRCSEQRLRSQSLLHLRLRFGATGSQDVASVLAGDGRAERYVRMLRVLRPADVGLIADRLQSARLALRWTHSDLRTGASLCLLAAVGYFCPAPTNSAVEVAQRPAAMGSTASASGSVWLRFGWSHGCSRS